LHPPAPARDHVQLLLLVVRVAVREAITVRDALVAEAALLESERLAREAELEVRCAVEVGPDVLQILLEVHTRERHGRDPPAHLRPTGTSSAQRGVSLRRRSRARRSATTRASTGSGRARRARRRVARASAPRGRCRTA